MDHENGQIRCVCKSSEDDGFTIQCELCLDWQHAVCVNISRQAIPEEYYCERCVNSDELNRKSKLKAIKSSQLEWKTTTTVSSEAVGIVSSLLSNIQIDKNQDIFTGPFNLSKLDFVVEYPNSLADSLSNVQVREIRNRGYQKKNISSRFGIFAEKELNFGDLVVEYVGIIHQRSAVQITDDDLTSSASNLLIYPKLDLAIDCRVNGNLAKFTRKSCRPNCDLKSILVQSENKIASISFGLFSTCHINQGEEIFLPLASFPKMVKLDCCCGTPEFCLIPSVVEKTKPYKHFKRNQKAYLEYLNLFLDLKKAAIKKVFGELNSLNLSSVKPENIIISAELSALTPLVSDSIIPASDSIIPASDSILLVSDSNLPVVQSNMPIYEDSLSFSEPTVPNPVDVSSLLIAQEELITQNNSQREEMVMTPSVAEYVTVKTESIEIIEKSPVDEVPKASISESPKSSILESHTSTEFQLDPPTDWLPSTSSSPEKTKTRVSFSDYMKKRKSTLSTETSPEVKKSKDFTADE